MRSTSVGIVASSFKVGITKEIFCIDGIVRQKSKNHSVGFASKKTIVRT